MKLNTLLFSALALVSADDFLELPIFRNSTKVTIAAKDGFDGVAFDRESLYANISVSGQPYTTHLEPEISDLWIFGDKPPASTKKYLERTGLKWDNGMYFIDRINYGNVRFDMAYALLNKAIGMNDAEIGGMGLGPRNSRTLGFPMFNGEDRSWHPTFADRIKIKGLVQSNAFTLNLATDPSGEDKLVYGAMDLSRFTGKLKTLFKSPSSGLITPWFAINGIPTSASLDIENPNSYFDDEIVAAVADDFGAEWDDNHFLYRSSALPKDDLILDFDGLEIRVPPTDIWVQDKQANDTWYFTIRPLSSHTEWPKDSKIGADLLRSVYIVYDLRHDRAAIGQANRNPGSANYEVIPEEGVPAKFLF